MASEPILNEPTQLQLKKHPPNLFLFSQVAAKLKVGRALLHGLFVIQIFDAENHRIGLFGKGLSLRGLSFLGRLWAFPSPLVDFHVLSKRG